MKGRNIFSLDDANAIREILRELRKTDRREQKKLRNTLREKFCFYIRDFDHSNKGFTEDDFNELIGNGIVHIEHIEVFGHIMAQCVWLRTCYNIFNTLYDSGDDETNELLRRTSHKFFDNLNRILHQYTWVLICRLTDKEKGGNNENVTIQSLDSGLCKIGLMTEEIKNLSNKLHCYRELIVPARNKIIAHSDKQVALENCSLGQHTEEEMRRFFSNLQKYMDIVGSSIGVGPCDFSVPDPDGDATDLILALRNTNCSYSQCPVI